jgi:glycosyltransferase involved in cell wall biosynthesis
MRIGQYIPTLLYGGAEAITVALHKGFLKAGHQSMIIANSAEYIAPRFRTELLAHGELQLLRTTPYSLFGIKRFNSLAHECNFDAIISHLTPTLMSALYNRVFGKQIPWIYVEHNPLSFLVPSPRTWTRRQVSRFFYPSLDRIAVVSPHIKKLYFDRYLPKFSDKVRVIPNGIDVKNLQQRVLSVNQKSVRLSLGIPSYAPVIGIIGRLVNVKGHIPFIRELIAQWDSFRPSYPYLLLVGDGTLKDAILAEARGSPLEHHLVMTGAVADISAVLSIIDIIIISSYSEGLPVNLLEAGAVGTTAIAMAVGGVPFVLSDNPEWMCPPGDYAQLVHRLRSALADKDNQAAIDARRNFSEKVSNQFDIDVMVSLYIKELEQIREGYHAR